MVYKFNFPFANWRQLCSGILYKPNVIVVANSIALHENSAKELKDKMGKEDTKFGLLKRKSLLWAGVIDSIEENVVLLDLNMERIWSIYYEDISSHPADPKMFPGIIAMKIKFIGLL